MTPKATFDVFLSHSTSDKPTVERLARKLEENGLKTFLDIWHLVPGEPWQEALENALARSQTVAVFLGPSGIGPWQNQEMREALSSRVGNRELRVIPVLLPGAQLDPKGLPVFLTQMTWVDFRSGIDDPEALRRLAAGIRGLPPGPDLRGTLRSAHPRPPHGRVSGIIGPPPGKDPKASDFRSSSSPVVFISYSHDSGEHIEIVLRLTQRLRQDGLDARIDQYVQGTPAEGWPRWMLNQLDEASFVLVVCTETYYRRFRGHENLGRGKGADWEGALITQEIYDAKSRTTKFVPVMLSAGQEPFIPEPLRSYTQYELTSEDRYYDLCRFLFGLAGIQPHQLGRIKPVPTQTAPPLTFGHKFVTPPALLATMIGVPQPNQYSIGRNTLLSRLHQQLQEQGISALGQAEDQGLGGIGKTQAAIEYVHRFGEHYRFALWVVAENEVTLRTAYLSIARDLGLVEAQVDFDVAVQAVKRWLSHEHNWLLVFDNADDPALLRAYLPPKRTDGKVLLTSRAKSFAKVGIKEPFRVETLSRENAVTFLIERTGQADAKTAAALAAELDYLPLALEQAGAYIKAKGITFADYLARFRRQSVALFGKGLLSPEYLKTTATAWKLSFDAVRESSLASAELLTAAAFLMPDSIPIEIFTRGGSKLGGPLARDLEGADEEPLVFWELLEPLDRYSLVKRLPDGAFKLHRQTQEMIKDALSAERRSAWAERVFHMVSAAYPQNEQLQSTGYLTSVLYALDNLARSRRLHDLTSEIKTRLLDDHETAGIEGRVASALAAIRTFGDVTGASKLLEQILQLQEHVLGAKHSLTTTSAYYLLLMNNDPQLINKLRWLLDCDEDSLQSTDLREIRQMLICLIS